MAVLYSRSLVAPVQAKVSYTLSCTYHTSYLAPIIHLLYILSYILTYILLLTHPITNTIFKPQPEHHTPTSTQPTSSSSSTPLRSSFAYMSPELAKRYILIQERNGENGVVSGQGDKGPGLGPGGPGLGPSGGVSSTEPGDAPAQGLGDDEMNNPTMSVKKTRVKWSGRNDDVQGAGLAPGHGPAPGPGPGRTLETASATNHNNNNHNNNSTKMSVKSSDAASSDGEDDNDNDDGDAKKNRGINGGDVDSSGKEEEMIRLEGGFDLAAMDIWAVGNHTLSSPPS